MFGLSPLGIVLIAILILLVIGPRMLPDGIEAVWLAITNLQRSQRNEPPLTIEEAREQWRRTGSMINQIVTVLRAVVEHLEEMRTRIFHVVIALVIGTAICFAFYNQIYAILLKPIQGLKTPTMPGQPTTEASTLVFTTTQTISATIVLDNPVTGTANPPIGARIELPKGTRLNVETPVAQQLVRPVFLRPAELFLTTFRIAVLGGVALALPVIIYEVIAFIWPALIYASEKRWVYIIIPSASFFFVAGILFSYFFMLPFALRYLLTFGQGIAVAMPSISEYVSFATNLMFWVGIAFETPLAVFFLAKSRIVSYQRLKSMWKFAFLIAFVVGAIITPTPDPVNQAVVAIPIFVLYLIGLLFARFA